MCYILRMEKLLNCKTTESVGQQLVNEVMRKQITSMLLRPQRVDARLRTPSSR
jgi:hypothetical protein